ncbi:MAG TPA: carboxypeptidase regulatory-like domain-containing protein [Pyrinomonadaceae bacterium]|nr:carboxypeptidase regulatory-like domain-containing protein [Pyrinomonadaceae bacterium]
MRNTLLGCIRAFIAAILVLGVVDTANAQFKASLQGTVTDSAGAIVSNATVTLTNKETNKSETATSSDEGFYKFSGLAPGAYSLTVEKESFKKQVIENVMIAGEAANGVNVQLEAGAISEVVTVTSENVPLETEDANVRKTITTREIQVLPQVGRDPYQLARLAPGVFGAGARSANGASANLPNTSGPGGSSVGIFATENQVQISANGQRLSANNFQIDGVSVNSQTWGGSAVITPSQESVKEVQVTSSTYSAEDGRNSGAQVKVVTQNGTNDFHGSAFFKYNTPAWNAFNKGFTIPGTTRGVAPQRVENRDKTFGGSLGGRIVRDKVFFFFSYEGLRNSSNTTFQSFVETPQLRQLIRTARPTSKAATILGSPGIEPRIVSILPRTCADFAFSADLQCTNVAGGFDIGSPSGAVGQYVPFNLPRGGGLDGIPDLQYALLENPASFRGNQYFTRADFSATDKDKFAFSTFIAPVNALSADPGGQTRPFNDIRSERLNWDAAIIYTRTFSATMLNEARFNITKWGFDETQSNPDTNFGVPRIEIEGLLPDGNRLRFGAPRGENTPGVISERQFQFSNILTRVMGNMSWRFGGEYRLDLNDNGGTGGARPLFSFVRPWNFANDTPIFEAINADFNGQPQANNAPFKTSELAFFAQDDWKVRPNLTVNLGLRWSYYSPITARGGRQLSNLVFGSNGFANATLVATDKLTDSDFNNFGPQIGFAWSPKYFNWENKMVIRGGFGIGYDRLPNALLANARANPPNGNRFNICCGTAGAPADGFGTPFVDGQILYVLGSSNSPTSYPRNPLLGSGINPNTGGPNVGTVEVYGANPELPTSHVYRYSLEGQYELPGNMVGTLGYQGSASRNFVRIEPLHLTQPVTNPTFNPVFYAIGDVRGNYNAMLVRLQRRFAQGFQFDLNYKFSKSLDTYSYEAPCACTNQTFPVDQNQEYGPSDFDVRHFITFSGIWDLPFYRNQKSSLAKLVGGWQVSGILTKHSGFPWTPKIDQSVRGPNGNTFGPVRPVRYLGGQPSDNTNDNFLRPGGIFPGGGAQYFSTTVIGDPPTFQQNPPGIGRNPFRGPKYLNVDMTLSKRFGLPNLGLLGETPAFEVRFNFFNIFNIQNLAPFQAFSNGVFVNRPAFGEPDGVLAGRVVEFQARFSF